MKISCPSCAAKYSIADEKVQDRLAKIRCRKCGTTIVIDGKVQPPTVSAGEAASGAATAEAPAGAEYSVDFGDGAEPRTMTVSEIASAYHSGQITGETFVWSEALGEWKALAEVPEIVEALHAGSGPAAAPAPVVAPAADLFGASPEPPRAAARAGGRGSTADLFGSVAKAGSEDDVATSATLGTSAPAAASAGATGARNESSVLFSLSALTKQAEAAPAARKSATTATREDSGLIDLKALTAPTKTEDVGLGASPLGGGLGVAPLGVAPLGMASPLATPAVAAPPEAAKSKAGIFIGAGIAVAALVIAGAIVLTSKKDPPPTPVAAPQATPTQTQEEPKPAPTPTVVAAPPPTGTAEEKKDDTKPATAQAPRRAPSGGGGPAAKPAAKPDAPAAPAAQPAAAPPAKPKGGCAAKCPPGDLQCAMRCAASGG